MNKWEKLGSFGAEPAPKPSTPAEEGLNEAREKLSQQDSAASGNLAEKLGTLTSSQIVDLDLAFNLKGGDLRQLQFLEGNDACVAAEDLVDKWLETEDKVDRKKIAQEILRLAKS